MRDLGQRAFQRILRSRVLPLLLVLFLFAGLVSISGYLLWQAKIKQEISLFAEFMVQRIDSEGSRGHVPPMSVVLRIHRGEDFSFLAPGDTVRLEIPASGGRISLAAQVVGLETAGAHRELVVAPEGAAAENRIDELWRMGTGKSVPVEMTIVVRKQRLLSVALTRGRVN